MPGWLFHKGIRAGRHVFSGKEAGFAAQYRLHWPEPARHGGKQHHVRNCLYLLYSSFALDLTLWDF